MRFDAPPFRFADVSMSAAADVPPETLAQLTNSYRPWRKVRYISQDLGIPADSAWKALKAVRKSSWVSIPISRVEGGNFGFCATPHLSEPLFRVDRAVNEGEFLQARSPGDDEMRAMRKRWKAIVEDSGFALGRVRVRSEMDEAAESSIMEGASTTRRDAIDLLRSGRAPSSSGERMILNNYVTLQRVKQWLDRPLSVEMLLETQDLLTQGTLQNTNDGGRLRTSSDNIRVVDARDNSTLFVPPEAGSVRYLLQQICDFANTSHTGARFVHPLVKASILHFLIGYVHPFIDGNGRTARAVFYWFALRSGYRIFEYLTISEIIRKGFSRYPQAYLDCELDDGDLTYFVLYKLDVISQALDRLGTHLSRESDRLARSDRLLSLYRDLNVRQRLLLDHGTRHPLTVFTVKAHALSNGVVKATARADLEDLLRRKLMVTSKRGKEVIYHIASGVAEKLAKASR